MDEVLFDLTERAQADHFWYHGFRAHVIPTLRTVAAGRTDLRLIDCGCGTGHNLELLRPHGHAVGFDFSTDALAHARRRGSAVLRADGRRVPFRDNTFDIATAFDVMQCTADDEGVLREMTRIVRPGGAVVMTMAAFDLLRGDHSLAWQEFRRYTPASARALAGRAGLRVESLRLMFASLVPLMLSVRLMQRLLRPVRGARSEDTDLRVPAAPINAMLTALVRGEAALAPFVSAPVGSSILLVARKA